MDGTEQKSNQKRQKNKNTQGGQGHSPGADYRQDHEYSPSADHSQDHAQSQHPRPSADHVQSQHPDHQRDYGQNQYPGHQRDYGQNQHPDRQEGQEANKRQHSHAYQDYVDLNIEVFVRLAELYKNFSDPTRLKIIHELSKGALHVQEIADRLGMSQSAISHQLRILRNVRLVKFEREGRSVRYALDDNHVEDILRIGVEHVQHTAQ